VPGAGGAHLMASRQRMNLAMPLSASATADPGANGSAPIKQSGTTPDGAARAQGVGEDPTITKMPTFPLRKKSLASDNNLIDDPAEPDSPLKAEIQSQQKKSARRSGARATA